MSVGFIVSRVSPFIEKVEVLEATQNWISYIYTGEDPNDVDAITHKHLKVMSAHTLEGARLILKKLWEEERAIIDEMEEAWKN